MKADRSLIDDARARLAQRKLKGTAAGDAKEELARLIGDYETACSLSRGKDITRSEHWEAFAKRFAHRLRIVADTGECSWDTTDRRRR